MIKGITQEHFRHIIRQKVWSKPDSPKNFTNERPKENNDPADHDAEHGNKRSGFAAALCAEAAKPCKQKQGGNAKRRIKFQQEACVRFAAAARDFHEQTGQQKDNRNSGKANEVLAEEDFPAGYGELEEQVDGAIADLAGEDVEGIDNRDDKHLC